MRKPHRNQPFRLLNARAQFFFVVTATALAVMILVSSAFAQAVPLPRPAPKARDGVADNQRPAPMATIPTSPAASTPPTPIIPDLRSLFGGSTPNFDANQKNLASKVSNYLSAVQNLSGNFVQVGPDGSRTTGDFFIQKPGKVRFEYDAPSTIAIVSNGSSLVVRDRKLSTQDVYPLSQTPLRFLLSDRIDLMRDTNLVGVTADDMFISVTIEEKQPLIGTSRLMLMIGAKDNQLKQWTVTDPQGYDTTVAVYNLDTTKKLDPNMFRIDFTNYQTPNN